jgi:hypothetical protein
MVRVPGSADPVGVAPVEAGAVEALGVAVGEAGGLVEGAPLDVAAEGAAAGPSVASALPRQAAVSSTERAAAVVPSARMRGSVGGCL